MGFLTSLYGNLKIVGNFVATKTFVQYKVYKKEHNIKLKK